MLDPAAYVELWLRDAGRHGTPGYLEAYDAWLGWFEGRASRGSASAGSTSAGAARPASCSTGRTRSSSRSRPAIGDWGRAVRLEVGLDDRLIVRADVLQETHGAPGAEDPETIVLRQQTGLRRARQVDTVEAALAGACDGDLTVGQILDALAQLLERDRGELRTAYLPVVRELVARGLPGPGLRYTASGTGDQSDWTGRATVSRREPVNSHRFMPRSRQCSSQEKQWHTSW